jgi:flagellin
MVVQHNLTAMNSNRMLGVTTSSQAKSTEKLSSGYKINRAADDAAGLAISEKMRRQIRGLTQATANAQDGISLVQTAEGALAEVHDMLQRINELAVQSANGTNMSKDREYLDAEVQQLTDEINKVADSVTFNEQKLLNGEFNTTLQVGSEKGNELSIKIDGMDASTLGVGSVNIKTADKAKEAISSVKTALELVSAQRADLGAIQNRLEHKVSNLNNIVENTTAAESRIRDTDMASEMVKFTNNNVLAQAGTAMLAQANQSNQSVLSLLG